MYGFALFNKPVAWLLYLLATNGHVAAAILLPLYFCADATVTLIRRALRRERLFEAHRSHFYQRATDNGFTAMAVAGHVFAVNLALLALASATLILPQALIQILALASGLVVVTAVLWRFSRAQGVR